MLWVKQVYYCGEGYQHRIAMREGERYTGASLEAHRTTIPRRKKGAGEEETEVRFECKASFSRIDD